MTVLSSSSGFVARITSYAGLLTELTRLIDGEDTSVSDIARGTLTHIINMGERKVYREVRSRHNERDFSAVTVTSNLAAIPADFEASSVVHFGGKPLLPVAEEWLREYLDGNPTGACRYFAEAGSSFLFGPAVTDGTLLQGRYFCRWADLSETTLPSNELFQYEPDLFIYAALSESAGLFGQANDSRVPMWNAKYESVKNRLNTNKNRAAYSAGRIRQKPSTTLMG